MTKTELKKNITKIKKLLRSNNYEAGIELLKTINEPELNEALADLILEIVKENYLVHELACHFVVLKSDKFSDKIKDKFSKGLKILYDLLPNLKSLDLSDAFEFDDEASYRDHDCMSLLDNLKPFKNLKELYLFKCRNLQVKDGLEPLLSLNWIWGKNIKRTDTLDKSLKERYVLGLNSFAIDIVVLSKKEELHNYLNVELKKGCFGNKLFKKEEEYSLDNIGSASISYGYDNDVGNNWTTHEMLHLIYNSDLPDFIESFLDEKNFNDEYKKTDITLLNFSSIHSAPITYIKKLVQKIIKIDNDAQIWFRAIQDDYYSGLYNKSSGDLDQQDTVLVWGGYGNKKGFSYLHELAVDMPMSDHYENWDYLDEAIGDFIFNIIETIDNCEKESYNKVQR